VVLVLLEPTYLVTRQAATASDSLLSSATVEVEHDAAAECWQHIEGCAGVAMHFMQLHHSFNVSLENSLNLLTAAHSEYCAECVLAMHDGSRLC
jgi:hypothetical protein